MLRTSVSKRRAALIGLLAIMAGLAVTMTGCAKNPTSYNDPYSSVTTTKTANALIDAATLKGWMDEG
jgi:hypothetical protein